MNMNTSSINEHHFPKGTAKQVTTENLESALFASTMFTNTPTNHARLNPTDRSALRDAALTGTIAEGLGIFPASSVWSATALMKKSNPGKPGACLVRIAMIINASSIPQRRSTRETTIPGTPENPMPVCFASVTITNP